MIIRELVQKAQSDVFEILDFLDKWALIDRKQEKPTVTEKLMNINSPLFSAKDRNETKDKVFKNSETQVKVIVIKRVKENREYENLIKELQSLFDNIRRRKIEIAESLDIIVNENTHSIVSFY